jgi:hypothetical protein
MKVRSIKTGDTWWEEMNKPCTDSRKEAEWIIAYFNATLAPNESPRELVAVRELLREEKITHQWEKQNAITRIEKGRIFDVYKCVRCGVTGKRFGLSEEVRLDPKHKRKIYCK